MKPIIFSTPMVRAILDGRKTQTRMVIKPQPDNKHQFALGYVIERFGQDHEGFFGWGTNEYGGNIHYAKPPYQSGDVLWVRETWTWLPHWNCESDEAGYCRGCTKIYKGEHGCFIYKENMPDWEDGWCSPIHMPREAARIFLKVTNVKVERLHDITENDARNEGVKDPYDYQEPSYYDQPHMRGLEINKSAFAGLWDSLNAKRGYGWDTNPWVWVVAFEKISRTGGE